MKKYVKSAIVVLTLPVLLIAGCEQRYRYPCQNPENWQAAQCQKPVCDVHRECPDNIFKDGTATAVTN